ncbi:hypothetical protein ACS0TY_018096 [Phlomoides rotata]
MGFGMVLRDSNGLHIIGRTMTMSGVYVAEECEAIGLFKALSWIKKLDFRNDLIKMDVKVVMNAFNATDVW